ncbi:MAG: glucose-1-phosphate cytidylyltransferase [Ilumatobacteraceae bacterium]
MKTVILCGGYGTRIRDVAEDIPKPMIPIGGYPILWHLMKYYAAFGHDEFILCLGHKGQSIRDFFLNYESQTRDLTVNLSTKTTIDYHSTQEHLNWKVTLVDTGADAMTGARIRKIQEFVRGERFMLTYGDGLSNVDIEKLLAFHTMHGKKITVTGVRPPARFGELQSDGNGNVTEFNEKPQASGGRISGGFFVCEPSVFEVLDEREDLVFEEGPIKSLVAERQMALYEHDDFWQCMDTYRDWQLLNGLAANNKAPWQIW